MTTIVAAADEQELLTGREALADGAHGAADHLRSPARSSWLPATAAGPGRGGAAAGGRAPRHGAGSRSRVQTSSLPS